MKLSPDPAIYDPKISFSKCSAPAFGFGTGKRDSIDAKGK